MHPERRALPGRCREGVWASQNIEVNISADPKPEKFTRLQNALLWVKKPSPFLFYLVVSCSLLRETL